MTRFAHLLTAAVGLFLAVSAATYLAWGSDRAWLDATQLALGLVMAVVSAGRLRRDLTTLRARRR